MKKYRMMLLIKGCQPIFHYANKLETLRKKARFESINPYWATLKCEFEKAILFERRKEERARGFQWNKLEEIYKDGSRQTFE